ncbi:hypothetical protein BG015_007658 [Linnemannia schmuckeri]|uniref:Uncharacterized protein n=1 Tax=Linnemannia schmuckeri TaxID=64567 RepID=A0A9P5RYJ0_9FUNG|nr:hypothetical protein BG015_007658 [Linnemannia schmuckeri]
MAPASETFFSIPELVDNLAPYLTSQDLLQLLQTNRNSYTAFTPYFWTDVTINTSNANVRLMESPEACEAFYRNIGFIRFLRTKADFLLFYIEGLYAYIDSRTDAILPHPNYLRRPATTWGPSCSVFPFPPITQLVRLDVSTDTAIDERSFQGVSTTALDLGLSMCWFISLNRGLIHLTLRDEPLKGHHLGRVFARTVSRLPCLRHLRFSCIKDMASSTFHMILLTCPSTLESLEGYNFLDNRNEEYSLDLYNSMEMDEEGPLEVRQQPLYRLTQLKFPWNMLGYETDQLVQMMKVCPNVEAWDVPLTRGEGTLGNMAVAVKDMWPHLRELTCKVIHFDYHGQGVLPILEEIEMNQLQVWTMGTYSDSWPTRTLDAIQRHSETLREIRFPWTYSFKSSTIQGILTNCQALEHLEIGGTEAIRIKLWLDDMDPEVPWVSTRLRFLKMVVDWNDKRDKPYPPPMPVPSVQMSINVCNERMSAILASRIRLGKPASVSKPTVKEEVTVEVDVYEANRRRWSRLQWFYKQLGRLTELNVLDIRATTGFAEEEPTKVLRHYSEFTFPRLLSLSDDDTTMETTAQEGGRQQGKVGYLSELGQLKKLRELRGSFRVDRPAVKTYMGQKEVEFIHAHWPELRVAEFLPEGYETLQGGTIPSHMQWLIEQRPFTKLSKTGPGTPQYFCGI